MAWLVLPTLVVAGVVLVLMNWPTPADVDIGAIAMGLQFRGHGPDKQVLLESTSARWLALQGFDEIRLTPTAAWIADPTKHNFQHDTYPSDAWSPLPLGQSLVLRPAGRTEAAVTIQPLGKLNGSLALGEIFVGSADITLRSPEKGNLSVELRGQKVDGDVPLPEEFRIDADRCVREGAPLSHSGSPMTLRVLLRRSSQLLEYSSQRSGMRLALGYSPDRKESFLGKAGFAVDQVRFLDQGPTGQPESTLAGAGVIEYARYPVARPVQLSAGDFLSLGDLRGFYLREIAPADDTKSLRVHLGGVAGKIRSGPAGRVADRRLTYFNSLRQNPIIVTLFTILAWVVPTLIAVRKFYRELH
jgi:hypothetical protein